MFKNMSLGMKLGCGFGVVVIIAIILGLIAVVNMKSVEQTANILVNENVPEVAVANNVERSVLKTKYLMRSYVYTEDEQFLIDARESMSQIKKYLADTKQLGESSPRLAKLKETAQKAETAESEYEALVDETADATNKMEQYRTTAEAAARIYMDSCYKFLDLQEKQNEREFKKDIVDKEFLKNNLKQMKFDNDLLDIGNWIIIGTWKSQLRRSPEIFKDTEGLFKDLYKKSAELRAISNDPQEIKIIDDNLEAAQNYQVQMDGFLKIWLKREEFNKERNKVANSVADLAQNAAKLGMDDTSKGSRDADEALSVSANIMLIGLVLGMIMAIFLAFLITIGITKAIVKVVRSLNEGSGQTSSAAQQVASSSQQLSQGTTEQASSLEETSSALDQMTSMIKLNADNAAKASLMAAETKLHAEKGDASMKEMKSSMKAISDSAGKVGKIIKTIEEIAFQTNILALNAAVEAARAGEHGRGFAVVADEVRNLAQRASVAVKDTQSLIENSQASTREGVEITKKTSEALVQIMDAAKKVADVVNEIALASKEQAEGINQVTHAINQMDQVTQQNAASAEESAAASEELASQAENLQGMVLGLEQIISGKKLQKSGHFELGKELKGTLSSLGNKSLRMTGPNKGPKVLKPEDIIPFEDKEAFKDF